MEKVNLQQKFSTFTDYWDPKIVGQLNGQDVKLVKIKGPFTWHKHEHEDELFFVFKGSFVMEMRDKDISLTEGDFLIVPRGVEHRPNAVEEAWIMLFEPSGTLNTGNVRDLFTKDELEKI